MAAIGVADNMYYVDPNSHLILLPLDDDGVVGPVL